jgi:hypothetical protein
MNAKPAKPITESLRRQIETRAYLLWERDGRPHGRHEEHWARAEKEVLGESKVPAKKKTKAAPPPKKSAKPKKK